MSPVSEHAEIDLVDADDHVIGAVRRSEVLERGANFRTVHVLLGDERAVILQQIAPGRPRHAGRWGATIAAYVARGETYEAAANRRLYEELGARAQLARIARIAMQDGSSRKFVELFLGPQTDVAIREPGHIAAVELWRVRDIAVTIERHPERFTPTFASLFATWQRSA